MNKEEIKISISVELIKDGETYIISTNNESEKLFNQWIYGQGKSVEEAEKKFWEMLNFHIEYHVKRSIELDKWKLFQKGDWKHIGGTWFIILGINVNFRYGKGMKGGWYIPFTKLNISIHNNWRSITKPPKG